MNPIAVLISDVHYSVHTIRLADAAMRQAIDKANELEVPLIVAGDLHDTKANLRGECIKAMIDTFKICHITPFILIGNHDRWNEKSPEHSLEFLKSYSNIVERPLKNYIPYLTLIPYNHDPEDLRNYLKTLPAGSTLIMHQGLTSSKAGHYIQDKSAINAEDVKDFRVISGHYHTRQSIKTGRPQKGAVGLWDYIGNPYTTNYGEADDSDKGFQILMDDGSLEFIPTNLRKHIIIELDWNNKTESFDILNPINIVNLKQQDLVWFKYKGPQEMLYNINRKYVSNCWEREVFKLDLIPTETTKQTSNKNLTQGPLLDNIIDNLTISEERKVSIKDKWKKLCE